MNQRTDEQDPAAAAAGRGDWQGVIDAWAGDDTPTAARWRRFAGNMLALGRRDPRLARCVHSAPDTGRIHLAVIDGQETPAVFDPALGQPRVVGLPPAAGDQVARLLAESHAEAAPLALAGAGSPEVLRRVADEPPGAFGRARAVWVIEPDYEVVRALLMVGDWSGPRGPLADPRFAWLVGPGWAAALRRQLDALGPAALPSRAIGADPLRADVAAVLADRAAADRAESERVAQQFAAPPDPAVLAERAQRLRAGGGRVLLMASRFTQVVGRSARALERSFSACGCETRLYAEDRAHDTLSVSGLQREAERFDPDLVVMINHRRTLVPGAVPAGVPLLTVIQDNCAETTEPDAGKRQGPLDLIAGPWVDTYVRDYGYPADRAVDLPRLSSAVFRGLAAEAGPVVYVSNHSTPPADLAGRAVSLFGRAGGDEQAAMVRAVTWLRGVYDAGGGYGSSPQMEFAMRAAATEQGWADAPLFADEHWHSAREVLFTHVNSTLYRQQGLGWARVACCGAGLELRVYGRGWEHHPEFAELAGGHLDGEEALAQVTHSAFASLMLEPLFPMTHPRSVDVWMSGGALLLRGRRLDVERRALNDWVGRLPAGVWTRAAALDHYARHQPADAAALGAFLEGCALYDFPSGRVDPVELVTGWRERGNDFLTHFPPEIEQTTFDSAAELEARLTAWRDRPAERRQTSAEQSAWVRERFSTDRGAERLRDAVADRLEAVARATGPG